MKRTKWLIYTVIVGLMPFFIRLLIWLVSNKTEVSYVLNEIDMVTFGLVLNITNINEIDDKEKLDKRWKTYITGFSVIMMILIAAFLGITYFSELNKTDINKVNIRWCSAFLGLISFGVSWVINDKLTKLGYE